VTALPLTGVVLSGTGGIWKVRSSDGDLRDVRLRGRVKNVSELKLAVGDEVMLEEDQRGGSWTIAEILPRHSQLIRREPGARYGERTVAANVDQVVIVFAAAKPDPHLRMLDRFLVIAESSSLRPRIVVNKIDLVSPEDIATKFTDYVRAGYQLHLTSVKADLGIQELRAQMTGRSSVFTGPSGAGKSSLLNSMYPGLKLRVGEISEALGKGQHTTVGALMHPLPDTGGGFVVDTPGLREVGLWGITASELDACFPEFRAHLGKCRFSDCGHVAEPGCAVREAVEASELSCARYESYVKLRAEAEEAEHARSFAGRTSLRR
jgi:ribosome biogenesis GTPase / thiamine phosphate phosphatase